MKSVLISCTPKECEQIANGDMTVLVREIAPREVPFKVYVYCTAIKDKNHYTDEFDIPIETGMWKGNSHIVGEFTCDKVDTIEYKGSCYMINNDIAYTNRIGDRSCLYYDDMRKKLGEKNGKAMHLTEVKIYNEPRELSEFRKPILPTGLRWENDKITRPPATYCYVEEE